MLKTHAHVKCIYPQALSFKLSEGSMLKSMYSQEYSWHEVVKS